MFPPKPFDQLEGLDAFRFSLNSTFSCEIVELCLEISFAS